MGLADTRAMPQSEEKKGLGAYRTLTHGALFMGIDGFGYGFAQSGIETRWGVEIDATCRSVVRRHNPDIMLLDDVCTSGAHNLTPVDIISYGSPCQDLSLAGRRKGLAGERSGLFFEAIRIIRELRPAIAIWENVPGALSSNGGQDFGAALNALADAGALDICWRVLDAQWFGVPQRRRRIFVVADFVGCRAASILFEPEGVSGYSPTRRETRARPTTGAATGIASDLRAQSADGADGADSLIPRLSGTRGSHSGGGHRTDLDTSGAYIPVLADTAPLAVAGSLTARYGKGSDSSVTDPIVIQNGARPREYSQGLGVQVGGPMYTLDTFGEHADGMLSESVQPTTRALTAEGHDASEDGTGRGTPIIPVASRATGGL